MKYTLGFLGAGNMAEAIAKAAIERGVLPSSQIIASDPSQQRRDLFHALGITVTTDNQAVIGQSSQVMLAVKPQMLPQVAIDLAKHGHANQVIQSILAGISVAKMNGAIVDAGGKPMRIVRIMPNTPMLVGLGMAGIATGSTCKPGDEALAIKLFSAGGKVIQVDESLIDSISAVSGSGPAYLFYLAQAMQDGAKALGLGEHARVLVAQTLLGAAQLLTDSPDDAQELRRKVTSPKGTTEQAIKVMDDHHMMQTIVDAMKAAERRSKELGK